MSERTHRSRSRGATWILRVGLVTALSLAISGTASVLAAEMDGCTTECDGSAGDLGCPPTCTTCACANATFAIGQDAPGSGSGPAVVRMRVRDACAPAQAPAVDDLFRPPIR